MRKISSLLLFGILAVLLTAGYTGYTFWQRSSVEVELEKVNYSISEYNGKILKYESDRVLQAVAAKQTVDSLKSKNIEWSKVIKDIRDTLPKTEDNADLINVLSYAGSSNNDISLNLKTVGTSENPFLDVAKVIAAFDGSKNFTDTFVPSIGVGEDKNGNDVLSFSLTTKYLKTDVVDMFGTLDSSEAPLIR
jgi:hypothetical protein